jgi:hypothetical protein
VLEKSVEVTTAMYVFGGGVGVAILKLESEASIESEEGKD